MPCSPTQNVRDLLPDELVGLCALLVSLMIFFSIDAKFRFRRSSELTQDVFRITSIVGGLSTAFALLIAWVELFLPEDNDTIDVLFYFVPSTIAILAVVVLAFEVLLLRDRGTHRSRPHGGHGPRAHHPAPGDETEPPDENPPRY